MRRSMAGRKADISGGCGPVSDLVFTEEIGEQYLHMTSIAQTLALWSRECDEHAAEIATRLRKQAGAVAMCRRLEADLAREELIFKQMKMAEAKRREESTCEPS